MPFLHLLQSLCFLKPLNNQSLQISCPLFVTMLHNLAFEEDITTVPSISFTHKSTIYGKWKLIHIWCCRPTLFIGGNITFSHHCFQDNWIPIGYLVSTYVVCERLSVMHEPAGVKMKIVRDLGTLTFQFQNTPPPPENENCQRSWHFDFSVSEYPPPPKMKIVRDLGTLTFQFQNTPPPENENCQRSWHFDFSVSEYPPPPKIEIKADLGTLRL